MTIKPIYKAPVRIVLTGGPGAGKTAVLEVVRHQLCRHFEVLPESAGIVFGGGFPRKASDAGRHAAQRAIFHVQTELESMALAGDELAAILCDRGTIDGLAYWPGGGSELFDQMKTSMHEELARYETVIHLRVPKDSRAYHGTMLRRESHREALDIDARLLEIWSSHPRRLIIDDADSFLTKARHAIEAIHGSLGDHDCTA